MLVQDDTSNIAVMLEMARALAMTPKDQPLLHSVIFNFNGAEETILQASHGFITQVALHCLPASPQSIALLSLFCTRVFRRVVTSAASLGELYSRVHQFGGRGR